MSLNRIASRYAKSLMDLARESNILDDVHRDLREFKEALKNRDLLLLIKSPIVNVDKKQKVFKALFEGRFSNITESFFNILIKKNREALLPEIVEEFEQQYRSFNKITKAKVITASTITGTQFEEIKAQVVKMGLSDGGIEIEEVVNPDIIGGYIIEVGDYLYDQSVKTQLANIKKQLADNSHIKSL